MTIPKMMSRGSSLREPSCSAGRLKAGSEPKTRMESALALTAARMTGIKLASEYSIITTSSAKMTPASGVLKEAAMPAAVPQPTKVRMALFGSLSACPTKLLLAAPRKTLGPSLPTEWPLMMATAAPKNCNRNSRRVR